MKKDNNKKIALVAGALDLPFYTRDALRKNGWDVFVVGLKNFYDKRLKPDMVVRIGGGGRALREFRRRGINKMTFVGALGHPNLSDLRPDLWTFFALFRILKNQRGYDSMAVAFIKTLKKSGYTVVAAQDLAPELTFEKPGVLTKTKPTTADKKILTARWMFHTLSAPQTSAHRSLSINRSSRSKPPKARPVCWNALLKCVVDARKPAAFLQK
jgi:DUF1009 family protein